MNVRHSRLARLVTLTVVASMPLLGMAGVASAKSHHAAPNCAKHPNRKACKAGGSGTGGGKGGPAPLITVTVDPNPLVETGASEVHGVIQVETSPSFAGDMVNIDSSQLEASCLGGVIFTSIALAPNGPGPLNGILQSPNRIDAVLDDDGNVTVAVDGIDCAPGTSVVEADLEVAPFYTALTTLVAAPPNVTPEGISGYPQIAGVPSEVETGDTSTSGDSNVYAVFYVETSPVYAEQQVEISSSQLEGRCLRGWIWNAGNQAGIGVTPTPPNPTVFSIPGGVNTGPKVNTILDDDGNAVFEFGGVSCAAGTSEVIADVLAGSHPTYVSEFTVLPPAPTI
ncbi:MAG TPA: hypothetical protein VNC61_15330 [Acidimicrobiales bacterium]|nr:hypothetical protein [Acidimicrobiales bacterium]